MANEFLNDNVGTTALDLINQLRGMNFTPSEGEMPRVSADPNELARHTVRDRAYTQMREATPEAPSYLSRVGGAVSEGLNRMGGAAIDPIRQLLQGNLPGAGASAAMFPAKVAMAGTEAAFSPITEAIRKYISEPIATGGAAGPGRLAAGALAEGALEGAVGGIGKLGKAASKGAKAFKGISRKASPPLKERRDLTTRLSDEEFAARRAERLGEVPNPQGALTFEELMSRAPARPSGMARELEGVLPGFRDPISHRMTQADPGFFGPLIENYLKSIMREGVGPRTGGGRAAAPEAPMVSELTRPWVGIYKGGEARGRTVPRSYRSPETYDLSEYQ